MSDSLPPPRRSKTPPKPSGRYELRPNSGALFYEDSKQTDKHPDARGRIRIGDRVFSIAAWVRTSQSGRDYLSIVVDKEFL